MTAAQLACDITLETIDALEKHPDALAFANYAEEELTVNGHNDAYSRLFIPENAAIMAQNQAGEYVGILVYFYVEEYKLFKIKFGFVREDERLFHIYDVLYEEAKVIAKALGAEMIQGNIHVANNAMLEVAKKQGRTPVFVTMRDTL